MEQEGRLEDKHIPKILCLGLMINAITIIFSVQYLYDNQRYIELIITSILFVILILLIRRFNHV